MAIRQLAILSVHTSPLAPMGRKKTGGMNVYVRELAQEIGRRGIQVDIFTRRTSALEPEVDLSLGDGVRVVYITAGPVQELAPDEMLSHLSEFTARLMAFTTRENTAYELIYSHYWLSGWVAYKLKEAWGIPFVQMFHTLGYMKQRIVSHGMRLPDQRTTVEQSVIDWADRIVAATPAEHAQLLWLYRARRQKIEIIPPGVNTDRFHPTSREEALQALGYDSDHRLLLFVGRIEPLKGVDTVIKALAVLRDELPDLMPKLRFAVIGGDPLQAGDVEMARLQNLVQELKLEEVVTFLGAKEQSLLPTYYTAAAAVLMPSDYESFGMVALEAMASGTPVIASEVGGLAYLVRDRETGYLVPVREPEVLAGRIRELVLNTQTAREMGLRASHLAREYAWPKIADRLLRLFEQVLKSRSEVAANR